MAILKWSDGQIIAADENKTIRQLVEVNKYNLRGANLRGADIDFSCWPLWCGSANVSIDERTAKQLLAHAFNAAEKYWQGGLTQNQKDWLNDFHRIKSDEFPKFK